MASPYEKPAAAAYPDSGDPSAKTVMGPEDIDRALTRMAFEIIEANKGAENLILMGIASRGYPLAQRIAAKIAQNEPGTDAEALVGQLDATLFRDDLDTAAFRAPRPTFLPDSGVEGKTVVLIDDVLYSGRTVRAALDALTELGRPQRVRLAVLVDRGHRELPIRADHVGRNLPTSQTERVSVRLEVFDAPHQDSVVISSERAESPSAAPYALQEGNR